MEDKRNKVIKVVQSKCDFIDGNADDMSFLNESFYTLGIDSLDYLQIITEIEDVLDISLENFIDSYDKKNKIADFIENVVIIE